MRCLLLASLTLVAACGWPPPGAPPLGLPPPGAPPPGVRPAAAPPPPPRAGSPAPAASPAEEALRTHRARLLAQRGVVDVRVDDAGTGLVVELCAIEAQATLDRAGIEVPVAVRAGGAVTTASGARCGCVDGGTYYEDGAAVPRDCNHCVCRDGHLGRCTLLSCEIRILDRAFFSAGSSQPTDASRPVLDAVAQALQEHPKIRVLLRGHAHRTEPGATRLSLARAETVRAYLTARGVAPEQLIGVDGVGATRPFGGEPAGERSVAFEVVQP